MKKSIFYLFLYLLPIVSFAQWGGGEKYPDLKPNAEMMEQFQNMKFGMFVHWGPSAIRGTSSWARGAHPYDFAPKIPIDEYDRLYQQFNPLLFDAKDWIATAKAAGMKYFIITTKHHDGFCLWDSEYTDYDIKSTPYKKDVLKKLSKACKRQGVMFGTYYSICDWHHPEYPGRYGGDPRPVESSDMEKYITAMNGQLDELIDKYKTNFLWFDGYWEGPWTHERGMDLYKRLRHKKDKLLINNRVDRMRSDREAKIYPERYAGDYKTPEQEIGTFEIDHPWESCITVSEGWFYRPQGKLKNLEECIDLLVQTVGGGGNLLLNIGPMPDGRMEMFQKQRLLEIGQWLKKYGETIYETRGGPFEPNEWTASTRKDNRIFLHVLDWPGDTLVIPNFDQQIMRSYLFDGAEFDVIPADDNTFSVSIPKDQRNDINTILVFETKESVEEMMVLRPAYFKNIKTIRLTSPPSSKYAAHGPNTVIDGIRGSLNYYENWIGFEGESMEAIIDLQKVKTIKQIKAGFLQNQTSWIFLPTHVSAYISEDGEDFVPVGEEQFLMEQTSENAVKHVTLSFKPTSARYVKLVAKNIGKCPEWHPGAGGKAWVFADEILVK